MVDRLVDSLFFTLQWSVIRRNKCKAQGVDVMIKVGFSKMEGLPLCQKWINHLDNGSNAWKMAQSVVLTINYGVI